MDENQIDVLYELLGFREETLRVVFTDGEIYDLCQFASGQDNDEEFPHCSALFPRLTPLHQSMNSHGRCFSI